VIRVQQGQNLPSGSIAAITLKCFHIHACGVLLAQTRRELDFAMDRIIVRDESADEPKYDGRRLCDSIVAREWVRRNNLPEDESGRKDENKSANRSTRPAKCIRAHDGKRILQGNRIA
jgi:hypothetical protein